MRGEGGERQRKHQDFSDRTSLQKNFYFTADTDSVAVSERRLTGKDFLEAVLGDVDSHSGRLKLTVVDGVNFFEMLE